MSTKQTIKETLEQTPPDASIAQPQIIPGPPGGGSWRWDAVANNWVPNDIPATSMGQE